MKKYNFKDIDNVIEDSTIDYLIEEHINLRLMYDIFKTKPINYQYNKILQSII